MARQLEAKKADKLAESLAAVKAMPMDVILAALLVARTVESMAVLMVEPKVE